MSSTNDRENLRLHRERKKVGESEGAKSTESVNTLSPTIFEVFWTKNVREEKVLERTDSMLGAGWTESFLANMYLGLFRCREFLKTDMGLTIVMTMGLIVTL